MNSFIGNIVAADSSQKEFSVKCPEGISGVVMGQSVLVIPIDGNTFKTEWAHLRDRLAKYNPKTYEFET